MMTTVNSFLLLLLLFFRPQTSNGQTCSNAKHTLLKSAFRVQIDLVALENTTTTDVVCSEAEKSQLGDVIEGSIEEASKNLATGTGTGSGSGSLCKVPEEPSSSAVKQRRLILQKEQNQRIFRYYGGMRCRRCGRDNSDMRPNKCTPDGWTRRRRRRIVQSKSNKAIYKTKILTPRPKRTQVTFFIGQNNMTTTTRSNRQKHLKISINRRHRIDLGPISDQRKHSSSGNSTDTIQWTINRPSQESTQRQITIEIPAIYISRRRLDLQISLDSKTVPFSMVFFRYFCKKKKSRYLLEEEPMGRQRNLSRRRRRREEASESFSSRFQLRAEQMLLDFLDKDLEGIIKPGHCMYRNGGSIVQPEIKLTPKPGWEERLPEASCGAKSPAAYRYTSRRGSASAKKGKKARVVKRTPERDSMLVARDGAPLNKYKNDKSNIRTVRNKQKLGRNNQNQCYEPPGPVRDFGYDTEDRGYYDIDGCCYYCRWVGESGPGRDLAGNPRNGESWFSCRINQEYSLFWLFQTFPYRKCNGKRQAELNGQRQVRPNEQRQARPNGKPQRQVRPFRQRQRQARPNGQRQVRRNRPRGRPRLRNRQNQCYKPPKHVRNWGYDTKDRGYYSIDGCCYYCRWVGESGPGRNAAINPRHGESWFSCRIRRENSPFRLFQTFPFKKCEEQRNQ